MKFAAAFALAAAGSASAYSFAGTSLRCTHHHSLPT